MFEIPHNTDLWKTYFPLMKKQKIANEAASCCIMSLRTAVDFDGKTMYDPAVSAEDVSVRWRLMMGVLLDYLGISFEPVEGYTWLMAQDDFDRAAANHPLNVLERMKANAAERDKVFDLLRDYKETDRLVSAEINARIAAMNDLLPRTLAVLMQTVTPDALQQLGNMEKALGEKAKEIAGTIQNAQKELAEARGE